MKKTTPIREGVSDYLYRTEGGQVFLPLTAKELEMIHTLIDDDWTSKVDMNRKSKTPSDIPVPPIKYHNLLYKLAHAEESLEMSEYQF